MTHWTQLLEEGKRIFKDDVSNIEKINSRIAHLIAELDREIKLLHIEEDLIFQNARKQYSIEEITQAKERSKDNHLNNEI